LKGLSS